MFEKEVGELCKKADKYVVTTGNNDCTIDAYIAGYHEWHYVKDGLPEKEKYVLVYTKFKNVYIARLVKDNYFINKKGGFVQTSDVIA